MVNPDMRGSRMIVSVGTKYILPELQEEKNHNMPAYEIEHIIPLDDNQKDELAQAITRIHSELSTTPSLFVNVRFTNVSEHMFYIAGKRIS